MKRIATSARHVRERSEGEGPVAALPDGAACACTLLRRAARRITSLYDDALVPTGLRITQYSLLANIERRGSVAMTALAELLAMDRSTLTRNLGPLQRARLVSLRSAGSGRTKLVTLTETGRARLREALPHWERAQRHAGERALADAAHEFSQLAETLARSSRPA